MTRLLSGLSCLVVFFSVCEGSEVDQKLVRSHQQVQESPGMHHHKKLAHKHQKSAEQVKQERDLEVEAARQIAGTIMEEQRVKRADAPTAAQLKAAYVAYYWNATTTRFQVPEVPAAASSFACQQVLLKAMTILQNHSTLFLNLSINTGNLNDTLNNIKSGTGPGNAAVVAGVIFYLQSISLREGLQNGQYVWTSQDQSDLTRFCQTGSNVQHTMTNLEENTMTDLPLFLFEGDMVAEGTTPIPWTAAAGSTSGAVNIRYCFDSAVSPAATDAFKVAVAEIAIQVPGLTFQSALYLSTTGNCNVLPSVVVRGASTGCWSHLGQVSGVVPGWTTSSQYINLGSGCESTGMILHQLGHTLGLQHELTRSDRSQWVSFNKSVHTLTPTMSNFGLDDIFVTTGPRLESYDDDNFDFLSIMMPMPSAFTKRPEAIRPAAGVEPMAWVFMGQRMGLSGNDVRRLGQLYPFTGLTPLPTAPMTDSEHVNLQLLFGHGYMQDGSCYDEIYTGLGYTDGSNVNHPWNCLELRFNCTLPVIGDRAKIKCPWTCLQCIQAPAYVKIAPAYTMQSINASAPPKQYTRVVGASYTVNEAQYVEDLSSIS